MFRAGDANREQPLKRSMHQLRHRGEEQTARSDSAPASSSSKIRTRPASSAPRHVSSQDIHIILQELVKASTEASDEDGGETAENEARKHRHRQRYSSFTHGLVDRERMSRVRRERRTKVAEMPVLSSKHREL